MSPSIYDLAQELVALILSDLDMRSLSSVLQTAHFLRPHAEYLLYRRVDLREGSASYERNAAFLTTIIRNPRLGGLVISFHPQIITDRKLHLTGGRGLTDLLADATPYLPNLETFALSHDHSGFPKCLQWDPSQAPPFQLRRLALHLRWGFSIIDTFLTDLVQLLQRQPNLLYISLRLFIDGFFGSLPSSEDSGAPETVCPSLAILESTNTGIRLLLPKRRVKSLFWRCERSHQEPLRAFCDLETDSWLRNAFFTPGLCEAYGLLENLTISGQVSLLPILSTFLLALKTLQLLISMPIYPDDVYVTEWNQSLFMRAIGEIRNLEVLEVEWIEDVRASLDPKEIFSSCRKLMHFGLIEESGARVMYSANCMERGAAGVGYSVRHGTSPNLPDLKKDWFMMGA